MERRTQGSPEGKTPTRTTPSTPIATRLGDLILDQSRSTWGARRYAPKVAGFIQLDLFLGALANLGLSADPLTANRYALAAGNPVSFVEWDGHVPPDGGGFATSGKPSPYAFSREQGPYTSYDYGTWHNPERREVEHRLLYGNSRSTTLSPVSIENPAGLGGTVRIATFIAAKEASFFGLKGLGDERRFDPQFSPERTRVYIEVDFDRNRIYAQANPSCRARDNCSDAKEFGGGFWNDFLDRT
jgi:hypothetical protein